MRRHFESDLSGDERNTETGFFDKMHLTPSGRITLAWEKSTVAKREDLPVKESL
jgi:hypothetical protein